MGLLFFAGNPYAGWLFVTALGILPLTLFPYFKLVAAMALPPRWGLLTVIILAHLLYTYAFSVKANAIRRITRDYLPRKWIQVACLPVFFFNDGLLLGFLSCRKRKPWLVLASSLVFLASIAALLAHLEQYAWIQPYYNLLQR